MTSNAPDTMYANLVEGYQQTLSRFVGPTQTLVSGNTLQLKDYGATDWEWSMFDPEAKQNRETVFPQECNTVREMECRAGKLGLCVCRLPGYFLLRFARGCPMSTWS